jgi:hypothetical protein
VRRRVRVQNTIDVDGYLVDSVGEGLSVASWVMLWFPLQLAAMEGRRAVLRRRRMRLIGRVLPDESARTSPPCAAAEW